MRPYPVLSRQCARGFHYSSATTKEKTSLDFTQRIERMLAEFNASENVIKRWLFEIISWFISASCMTAIVLIYVHIKDRPISEEGAYLIWTNVLGKVSSAALIVPTSEALGQLKWNWFHDNSRAMWDFEIFDKASRGPWGALMLLFRTKGRSLAALGALLVVLLLAIDSFFQQVVGLPDRWTLQSSPGVLPTTSQYTPDIPKVYIEGVEIVSDDKEMFYVLEKFAYGNGTQPIPFGNGTRPDIPLSCPTSNCTWPVYETLGVCSQCADISSYLEFGCLNNRVDWTSNLTGGLGVEGGYPNATMCGYFLNITGPNPILMSGYIADPESTTDREVLLMRTLPLTTIYLRKPLFGNGSIYFKEHRNPLSDVLIVSAANGSAANTYRNETPVAQECVLSWCVKTIESKYEWGEYEERVLDIYINTTAGPWPWISTPFQTESDNGTDNYFLQDIHLNIDVPLSGRNISSYGTRNDTASAIMHGFSDFFPAFTTTPNETASPVLRYMTWRSGLAWNRLLDLNPWLAPNDVARHMERLATAMTNVIRSADSKEMLAGNAWSKETYISIRWEWLTFPLLLLALSLVFLISTMVKTSKNATTGLWKTSAMPTLIYSLPKDAQNQFASQGSWKGSSDESARKTKIRLLPRQGWRVSGQVCTSPTLITRNDHRIPPGWI
ncbi:hypothetical protein BKA66DRAFT_541071 [Pyrenochaeta sp. MPI-SDFR-AT-0127]|nr:hypothetical protein BKA66DRAFT_541071 [Pyrenochaeta sp. MPI-SDFR-AT-0127]